MERGEGAAFLKAAVSLYDLIGVSYLCLNLPVPAQSGALRHCLYTSTKLRQRISGEALNTALLSDLGLLAPAPVDWRASERLAIELELRCAEILPGTSRVHGASFMLDCAHGETALFAFAASIEDKRWDEMKNELIPELRILASYFHSHVLRLNGHDSRERMLVTARELDCLKCTAEGRTAREAGRLLGISERTVRLHLNSAREKMGCANTTETVARAVGRRLISLQ